MTTTKQQLKSIEAYHITAAQLENWLQRNYDITAIYDIIDTLAEMGDDYVPLVNAGKNSCFAVIGSNIIKLENVIDGVDFFKEGETIYYQFLGVDQSCTGDFFINANNMLEHEQVLDDDSEIKIQIPNPYDK